MRLIRLTSVAVLAALVSCQSVEDVPGDLEVAEAFRGAGLVVLANASASDARLFEAAFCGGVIVGPRSVLTADHCVRGRDASTIDVIAGAGDICVGGYDERVPVVESRLGLGPDATLAHLTTSTDLTSPPARLSDATVGVGATLVAFGWGRSSVAGVPPCELRAVSLEVQNPSSCFEDGWQGSPGSIVCTLPMSIDNTCDGDSGGPVVGLLGGEPTTVAVTMAGFGCDPDSLGVNIAITPSLVEQVTVSLGRRVLHDL